jgi:hypothetical protein
VYRGYDDLVGLFTRLIREEEATVEEVANAYIGYIMDHYEYMRMIQHCVFFGKLDSQEFMDRFISSEQVLMDLFDALCSRITGYGGRDVRHLSHLFFATLNGILFNYGRFPARSREQLLGHMQTLTKLFGDLLAGSRMM